MISTLQTIPTPALCVDGARAKANIARLADYARARGIGVRPHTKTHKSRRVARLQIEAGALGLTAAKVGEAELMAQESNDILLAYPALDAPRTRRLAALARTHEVRVALDSAYAADAMAQAAREAQATVGVLVDIDVGLGRTGVQGARAALELAQIVARTAGLRFDGLFCYPGHIWQRADEQAEPLGKVAAILQQTIDLCARSGLECGVVSGGSTPTLFQSHLVPQQTEIRPGTSVYNDMNTVRGGFCALDDCAAFLLCTVVSDAVPGHVVIDAGSKTLGADSCVPAPESGFGFLPDFPDARVARLSEEHGQIEVTACPTRPQLGERVRVIPNHVCPCVNLQDAFWWLENGDLEAVRVDARGLLS